MRPLVAILLSLFALLGAIACASIAGIGDIAYTPDAASDDGGAGGQPGDGAIALVQEFKVKPADSTAPRTQTVTVSAGDLLVAAVFWGGAPSAPSMRVSDTQKNDWQPATLQEDNELSSASGTACSADAQLFYAANAKGGSTTITVTPSDPIRDYGFFLLEYAGIATSQPRDDGQGQNAPFTPSNQIEAPPLAANGVNNLVVALFVDTDSSGAITPGDGGYTVRGLDTYMFAAVEDNLPGFPKGAYSAPAYLPSGLNSNCWAAAAASFRSQ
jgi:hypothetical protein